MCLQKIGSSRTNIRSDVDFVITFEELAAMFDAKEINLEAFEGEASLHNATGAGRGYAVAGGVGRRNRILPKRILSRHLSPH